MHHNQSLSNFDHLTVHGAAIIADCDASQKIRLGECRISHEAPNVFMACRREGLDRCVDLFWGYVDHCG